jgi:hypothetical protein
MEVIVTYSLPRGTAIDIAAGGCIIVTAQPQTLPLSTVSYSVMDEYNDDNLEVGVVPSNNLCHFNPSQAFIDDIVVGSARILVKCRQGDRHPYTHDPSAVIRKPAQPHGTSPAQYPSSKSFSASSLKALR